jgi:N-acetylglucosamine-6-phosphate deacetylase
MLNHSALTIITGATLVHPDGGQSEGSVLIENGRVRSITPDPPAGLLLSREDVEVFSGEGCYLTPGLIELHFNGALGCDLNRSNIGAIRELLGCLPEYGVTSVVLTAITAPLTDLLSTIHTLSEVVHHKTALQCRPLGLHLEGPFISPLYRGAHPAGAVRPFNLEELSLLLSPMTRMVTIAPEVDPTGEGIRLMAERGIRVSMGHSNATFEDVQRGVDAGISSATHLFNAMRPLHQREPGLIATALADDRIYAQVIGDGAHVHPEAVKMVFRTKPPGRMLLTSDASPTAGMPEGSQVYFGGQTVTVQKQRTINREGVLAGSSQLIPDCVRNLVRWGIADFPAAIRTATANPAEFLGETRLGRLEVDCLADLVLWNRETLAVDTTFIQGKPIYQRQREAVTPT